MNFNSVQVTLLSTWVNCSTFYKLRANNPKQKRRLSPSSRNREVDTFLFRTLMSWDGSFFHRQFSLFQADSTYQWIYRWGESKLKSNGKQKLRQQHLSSEKVPFHFVSVSCVLRRQEQRERGEELTKNGARVMSSLFKALGDSLQPEDFWVQGMYFSEIRKV